MRQPKQQSVRPYGQGPVQAVAAQAVYRRAEVNHVGLRPLHLLMLQGTRGNRMVQREIARRMANADDPLQGRTRRLMVQRWPTELPVEKDELRPFGSLGEVFRYLGTLAPPSAQNVAGALLKKLFPWKEDGPYALATNAEVEQAKQVQDDLGISHGDWSGLVFEAKARLMGSPRKESDRPEAKAAKPQSQPGDLLKVKKRVEDENANSTEPKFEILYDDNELADLISFAEELGLTQEEYTDIILTGCRKAKPRSAEQLKDQMHNWKKEVQSRGFPYKFESKDQFAKFRDDLVRLIGSMELAGGVKVSTKDIRIQGSSLRTPFADDVDIAVFVTQEEYKNICAGRYQGRFKDKANKTDVNMAGLTYDEIVRIAKLVVDRSPESPVEINSNARTAANFILQGKFDGKQAGLMRPLYDVTEAMKEKYPHLNIESVTILVSGGKYELKPDLPLSTLEKLT